MIAANSRHVKDATQVVACNLSPPALRVVIVEVYVDRGQIYTDISPVISLETQIYADGSLRHGYLYNAERSCDIQSTIDDADWASPSINELSEIEAVVCTWPAVEDDARLASKIEPMKEQVERRMSR